jgi:hypothetical protein
MSKVISFSISDRYLDKLRSLYPSLTDNLAAKQFITDGLESSLGSGLDASLDDSLDDRVKTLIESWVDGLLEVRLDASVGKLITSLSERLTRLEASLDDSLDGKLDDMKPLLKREREASIAAPIPTIETGNTEPDQPAIETLPKVETVSTDSSIEPVTDAIETVTPEVLPSPPSPPSPVKEAIASIDGTVESVEPNSSIETVASAIGTVPKTHTAIAARLGLKNPSNLSNWIKSGIPKPYQDRIKVVERNGKKKIEWIT